MKFCAIGAVIGFTGFFVFSFLAFFAGQDIGAMQMVDIALALACLALGIFAWRKINKGLCNTPFGRG
ncbi:MAG TPA: hypothetical protein EYG79_03870 [Rhodobacteraceae bacterium]|nr:hypothetical protein [Paracoccaceae bacterium]